MAAREVVAGILARRGRRAHRDGSGIGAAYVAAAFALFRLFELEERRSAALETY
ncbi:MAG TPA: hypothetical protein VHF67_11520 [Gaiellaceae bacterium]|nr:hypothetical protein [Gaiellaceae bacterium]